MDRILKEMAETLEGGLHVEYTTGGGLFLSYRDKTEALALIQDILYADDLALAAETRSELRSAHAECAGQGMQAMGYDHQWRED